MPLTGPSQVIYGASGLIAGAKAMRVSATTGSNGAWSADFSPAGFAAAPLVFATAVSADATAGNAATATVTSGATTATATAGTVVVPNTIALGGLAVKAAGAGIVVNVLAIGS